MDAIFALHPQFHHVDYDHGDISGDQDPSEPGERGLGGCGLPVQPDQAGPFRGPETDFLLVKPDVNGPHGQKRGCFC